jgi:outer membrane biosynthesis protein TonB
MKYRPNNARYEVEAEVYEGGEIKILHEEQRRVVSTEGHGPKKGDYIVTLPTKEKVVYSEGDFLANFTQEPWGVEPVVEPEPEPEPVVEPEPMVEPEPEPEPPPVKKAAPKPAPKKAPKKASKKKGKK